MSDESTEAAAEVDESTEATAEVDESTEATAEAAPVGDYVRALLVERAGYLRMGKTERAAQVDVELARAGYVDAPADEAPARSRGQRTTKA